MKINIRMKGSGYEFEIQDENIEGDIFEICNKVIKFINLNKEALTGIESGLSITKDFPSEISKRKTDEIELIDEETHSEKIMMISKITQVDPESLSLIFDFDAESTVPPLIIEINEETRVENQRIATVILLHVNYILNQTNKLSSSELKALLERSDVESDELNKAFKGTWSQLIK
ncbi:MAG: hypothetical protein ACXADY_16935, partial [Candidatus Hodarchaeales archaeon]